MKIYEIGTGYTPIPAQMGAATEIVVEELTKAFLKQNVDVEIIDIAAKNRKQNRLPIREVKVSNIFQKTDVQLGLMHKLKRVFYSIALAREIKKILKNSNEKVVLHFHNQYNLFFFLKLSSKKMREKAVIAYTNHSGIWKMSWDEVKNVIKKRYFQEAECMKSADVVFALNKETVQNAIEHLHIEKEKFVIINNGVNVDIYHPLTVQEKEECKEKMGLTGKSVVLQVGSINENKGQMRTLEMLAPVMLKDRNLVYAFAGGIVSEVYFGELQELAQKLHIEEQVWYLGEIPPGSELNNVYNCSIATILASQYESFGLVVIESYAAGIPVMLNKEMATLFGEGCVPYEISEIEEVYTREIKGCNEHYQKLSKQARDNAVQNYSWEKTAREYLQELKAFM